METAKKNLLCRGREAGDGTVVVGYYAELGFETEDRDAMGNKKLVTAHVIVEGGRFRVVEENSVESCTGMADRMGELIFEGDRLRISRYPFTFGDKDNYYGKVFWNNELHMYGITAHRYKDSKAAGLSDDDVYPLHEFSSGDCEIIKEEDV